MPRFVSRRPEGPPPAVQSRLARVQTARREGLDDAVGSVLRRILPAMAITGAVFIAVRIVIAGALRPHYLSPVSKLVSSTSAPGQDILSVVQRGSHVLVTYQPASRFWAFQGIETGIYLVLAAFMIALAYRMVLRRDA